MSSMQYISVIIQKYQFLSSGRGGFCSFCHLQFPKIGKHSGGIGSAAVSTIHRKLRDGQHDVGQPLAAALRKLNFTG
jgi:hypothetical protein